MIYNKSNILKNCEIQLDYRDKFQYIEKKLVTSQIYLLQRVPSSPKKAVNARRRPGSKTSFSFTVNDS